MRFSKRVFLAGAVVALAFACSSEPPPALDCTPSCANKTCGSDGCGGVCGECTGAQACVDDHCVASASCQDGERNGTETDVDCGGRSCNPCLLGKACLTGTDCASGTCEGNVCIKAPTCDDGKKNGGETDVDCGGACGKCRDDLQCRSNDDCLSDLCDNGTCKPQPTCDDRLKNANETDVDCGGPTCEPCASGLACVVDGDCRTGICTDFECRDPTCDDERLNQDETDVDCGGETCSPCKPDMACRVPSDCTSGLCDDGFCLPPPTCTDGLQNGSETDVDCGGPECAQCLTGGGCLVDGDCKTGICTDNVCVEPTCFDGRKNQDETSIDCGGSVCAARCGLDEACKLNADCDSGVCDSGRCIACRDTCSVEGATQCLGDQIQACQRTELGCLQWSPAASCGNGRRCQAKNGVEACVNIGCDGVPAAGQCLDSKTIEFCAISPADGSEFVNKVFCDQNEHCQVGSGGASCLLPGDSCEEGATACQGSNTLNTCVGGRWQATTCAQSCNNSNPFGAFCSPPSQATAWAGKLFFMKRSLNVAKTDWTTTGAKTAGEGFLVVSMAKDAESGELRPFDVATTTATGAFSVKVPATPGPDDRIVVHAKGVGAKAAHKFAIADPRLGTSGTQELGALGQSPAVWNWSWAVNALPSSKELVITEPEGAGAANVFTALRRAVQKIEAVYPMKTAGTVVGWVGYGTDWNCDACSASWPIKLGSDVYKSQFWVSSGDGQGYWSDSDTLHALGHWVMGSFGTAPNEHGPMSEGLPTFQGQAWSEGFAAWFATTTLKTPVLAAKRRGAMSVVDLAERDYGLHSQWYRASPDLGLLQELDGNEIAAMLRELSLNGNEQALFNALASPHMNAAFFKRGYTRKTWKMGPNGVPTNVVDTGINRPSFPDFLDALMCAGYSGTRMDEATVPEYAYPYDSRDRSNCATGCGAGNCGGCCKNNLCESGDELSACGAGGGQCNTCASGQACDGGACVCNAESCPDGCCAGNVCRPGNTTAQCGVDGNACQTCASGQACIDGSCGCDASTCPSGCCDGNTCVAGTANSACGAGGLACVACGAGQTCEEGLCKSPEGGACVISNDCMPGLWCDSKASPRVCRQTCPNGTECGSGRICTSSNETPRVCVPPPAASSPWKIMAVRAKVRNKNWNGDNWDPIGAAPDPFLCFKPRGHAEVCTPYKSSTREPQWNHLFDQVFLYSSFDSLEIRMWDYDSTSANDYMWEGSGDYRPTRHSQTTWTISWAGDPNRGLDFIEFTLIPQ